MKFGLLDVHKNVVKEDKVYGFIFNEGGKYLTFSAHLTTGPKPNFFTRLWVQGWEASLSVGATRP